MESRAPIKIRRSPNDDSTTKDQENNVHDQKTLPPEQEGQKDQQTSA